MSHPRSARSAANAFCVSDKYSSSYDLDHFAPFHDHEAVNLIPMPISADTLAIHKARSSHACIHPNS